MEEVKIMNLKVSVIILAYNTEEYIAKAIDSALRQTERNIELIIVDDGSTDKTLDIIKSFDDKRIKVFVNQENKGQSFSTNLAIKESQGTWITRLDSDDWYAPNRLEKLLELASEQNIDMIADDVYFIQDGKTTPWSTLLGQSKFKIKDEVKIDPIFFVEKDVPGIWGLPLGLTKPLIKRNFLIQHNIQNQDNIFIGGDFWFYLTCLAYGANFLFVPKPYYFYRSRHGSSITLSQVKRLEAYCKATLFYLEQEFIKNNPQLSDVLQKRLILLERTRPYFKVIDSLKQAQFFNAILQMIKNPYFFYHLFTQMPRIIHRRLYFYLNKITANNSKYLNISN
ncbi:MAG: glycosyltransferase family 2 protein [Cyanobacteriota bacterium]|nr:glycosyltransferase family 2 protein [Cyanobacteriota bacterium]